MVQYAFARLRVRVCACTRCVCVCVRAVAGGVTSLFDRIQRHELSGDLGEFWRVRDVQSAQRARSCVGVGRLFRYTQDLFPGGASWSSSSSPPFARRHHRSHRRFAVIAAVVGAVVVAVVDDGPKRRRRHRWVSMLLVIDESGPSQPPLRTQGLTYSPLGCVRACVCNVGVRVCDKCKDSVQMLDRQRITSLSLGEVAEIKRAVARSEVCLCVCAHAHTGPHRGLCASVKVQSFVVLVVVRLGRAGGAEGGRQALPHNNGCAVTKTEAVRMRGRLQRRNARPSAFPRSFGWR